ncbi:hypothetical protein [Psychroserpens luteolus]|uniref:hypothetical protein n=1 Tax=Psychroserpens luteolus TaxID=2855840 RepID=UPI001E38AE77|nr:hypothetical protein [Psychroserpens luteolus]MCD2260601.1 hypothetical protein [Psychroserpens luteolus]
MKKTLTVLALFFLLFSYAQEKTITIDYTVKYLSPNKRKGTTDTITVGFEKNGKYIWTNSKALAKDLGKSMFRKKPELLENSDLAIIYDSKNAMLIMCFESGKNEFFMNVELSAIIPGPIPNDDGDEFELISEKTEETITIANREATLYDVYPSHKNSETISVALDERIKINNNLLFKKFFEIMFAADDNAKLLGFNIPDGLLMKVGSDEKTLIEAYTVDSTKKEITINYSFKIKE